MGWRNCSPLPWPVPRGSDPGAESQSVALGRHKGSAGGNHSFSDGTRIHQGGGYKVASSSRDSSPCQAAKRRSSGGEECDDPGFSGFLRPPFAAGRMMQLLPTLRSALVSLSFNSGSCRRQWELSELSSCRKQRTSISSPGAAKQLLNRSLNSFDKELVDWSNRIEFNDHASIRPKSAKEQLGCQVQNSMSLRPATAEQGHALHTRLTLPELQLPQLPMLQQRQCHRDPCR
jgi:hypothetical protein